MRREGKRGRLQSCSTNCHFRRTIVQLHSYMNIIAFCRLSDHTLRIIISTLELYPNTSYSSNPEAHGRFRMPHSRIILIYIHRRDWRSTKKRIIIRTMRGCSDKTPESLSLFQKERKRERERRRTSLIRKMFATIVLLMYGMYIFSSASVIAQTVLIYIICISLYLRVLSSGARARVLAIYLSAPRDSLINLI